jgi:hypothetical protein
MVDSQTSPTDESTSSFPPPPSLPPPPPPPPPPLSLPPAATAATLSSSVLGSPVATNQLLRPLSKSMASQSINSIDSTELKQKPLFDNQAAQIVVAKYSYEPLKYSPNDHPEVELPLNVGEYYLIYGDLDEVQQSVRTLTYNEQTIVIVR